MSVRVFAILDDAGLVNALVRSNVEQPGNCVEVAEDFMLPAGSPSARHRYHLATGTWVDPRDVATVKADKWGELKAARDAAEYGGFLWDGSTFDSDSASQRKIIGASQLATLVPNFSIDWTLSDNTARTLSAQDMIAVGMTLGQHVAAQHEKSRTLRQQIESATTIAEVESIHW